MPVFISHRTADDKVAQDVAYRLKYVHGITCYVDDFDQEASAARGTRRITSLIVARLDLCTHLLALVTENTKGSWWVPFEVGVARRAPRVISTFTNLYTGLPEFLTEWPVLRGDTAIDRFAELYKTHKAAASRVLLEKRASVEDQISLVDDFHSRLKVALGQT